MIRKISRTLLSITLILTMVFSNVVLAASDIIVAAAPSNIADSTNGVIGSNRIYDTDLFNDLYSGPTFGPADGVVVNYSNNQAVASSTQVVGFTNTIMNGVNTNTTQRSGTEDKGPTVREITSPAANEAAMKAAAGQTQIIGPGGTTYSAPNSSNAVVDANQVAVTTITTNASEAISYTVVNTGLADPGISAPAAILVNATSNQIYYSKNINIVQAPASLVNMLTAYLLLKYKGINDTLSVSARAVNNLEDGAATAGLRAGDTIKVSDALAAMFVKGCCDVANVVAENVGGSIENFVALMNDTAKSFGCMQSNFVNPSGLNNDAQVTTVHDMAIIMQKATDSPTLVQYMGLGKCTLPATANRKQLTLYSKNTIMSSGSSNYYSGVVASRMGYTSKALYTMGSLLVHNNQKLIAIILHANGSQFSDTKKLFEYGKKVQVTDVTAAQAALQAISTMGAVTSAPYATGVAGNTIVSNNALTIGNTTTSTNTTSSGQWVKDNNGWYFVKANGQRAVNEWVEVGGKKYCVDANGYMITGWRDFSNGKTYYFDPSTGELKYNTWVNLTTGSYYLQEDGSLAKATSGVTNITTSVGTYTIDTTGKAVAKVS